MNIDIFSLMQTVYVIIKFKGQLTRFTFIKSSINMYTIEKTLRNYGVLVYGRKLHANGDRSFLVKNTQAKWAEQLCFRANYPKLGVHFKGNEKYRGAGLPKRQWQEKGRKGDGFYALADLMAGVVGVFKKLG